LTVETIESSRQKDDLDGRDTHGTNIEDEGACESQKERLTVPSTIEKA
jgi:hypothetical protein